MKRIVVWFRNDLRLSDHPALSAALKDADEIIPFYCFDERWYVSSESGFTKTGPFRAQFIRESVADLQASLAELDAPLQIYQGSTVQALRDLKQAFTFDEIYCAEECSFEELELESAIEQAGFRLKRFWQYTLYRKEDLPFAIAQLPDVFTSFRKKMEKLSKVEAPLPAPNRISSPKELKPTILPSLQDLGLEAPEGDSRAVLSFKGGSKAAWQRLKAYFWEGDHLKAYKQTRNGLVGADYSSKFSPWLASGSISPREIYAEIKRYEKERHKNSSTYWLYFELVWRDFFRFTALKEGNHFFRIQRKPKYPMLPKLEAWRLGETGQDFVDANMKELLHTGFMSNRGRQNVASYLVHDLKLPWYLGAQWFESQLIDYDVCSNYGNWTYVAGIGHDPRPDRYFNVAGQADRYDADQSFRKLWLSEIE
jgi:deoxyribodipyrimidine photo-lyase